MPKIRVHEKALAHLSRGLYRSPASAIRELVSNAWDANATVVHISSGYPYFLQLAVQDNGDGFSEEDFRRLMEGGIGNSTKQPIHPSLSHGRPMIGRLGIGMLGLAQICGSFTIVSKRHDQRGFQARVHLYDMLRQRTDERDAEVVITEDDEVKEINVGEYTLEEFEPDSYSVGTTISSEDVHPTFSRSFQKSVEFDRFQEPPLDWVECIKMISKAERLQQLGDYWRLLWELAVSCPIPYVSDEALPEGLIVADQDRLLKYDFTVVVDGINLRKPVHLSGNPAGYTTYDLQSMHKRVYGKDLRFHGYLAVQEGKQLKPDELRGILIRMNEVGIGLYDPSMLDYRINEGPRSRWLTGEIYVEAGLEDALNIDRDSFNRFHPAFRMLQSVVHEILQTRVFPKVYKQIEVRSTARAEAKAEQRVHHVEDVLGRALEKEVRVEEASSTETAPETASVRIAPKSAIVTLPAAKQLRVRKPYRDLAAAVLAIFEISQLEEDTEERSKVFKRQLLDLLSKW